MAENESFNYLLVYRAGDSSHSVTISDNVPAATSVLGATGSKGPAPTVVGQAVTWTVSVAAQETITLTIQARANSGGMVSNQATFSGPQIFNESTSVLVYTDQLYLPLLIK